MVLFSERYKYALPKETLIREDFPEEVANGVCSCFDNLSNELQKVDNSYNSFGSYTKLEEYLWVCFLNKRKNDFYVYSGHKIVATTFLLDKLNVWYRKLDLIEFSIKYLYER